MCRVDFHTLDADAAPTVGLGLGAADHAAGFAHEPLGGKEQQQQQQQRYGMPLMKACADVFRYGGAFVGSRWVDTVCLHASSLRSATVRIHVPMFVVAARTRLPTPRKATTHPRKPPALSHLACRYIRAALLLPELRPALSAVAHVLPDRPFTNLLQVRSVKASRSATLSCSVPFHAVFRSYLAKNSDRS